MWPFLLLLAVPAALAGQVTIHLSPATNQSFDNYVTAAEAKMDWKAHQPAKSKNVEVAPWQGKSPIPVESGLIHDWVASIVVPGATAEKALALFQDYDRYKMVFGPEVVDSRLLAHEGSHWRAWLGLRRTKVMTVMLHTEYEIDYQSLPEGRKGVLSRSTKVAEVDDNGKELPVGTGLGFLWRLNAYWLMEPRPEGLYLECRSISLSRDIPVGLGWIVRPMVSSVPRDSVTSTVQAVRNALK
jgi:hypothetical protein